MASGSGGGQTAAGISEKVAKKPAPELAAAAPRANGHTNHRPLNGTALSGAAIGNADGTDEEGLSDDEEGDEEEDEDDYSEGELPDAVGGDNDDNGEGGDDDDDEEEDNEEEEDEEDVSSMSGAELASASGKTVASGKVTIEPTKSKRERKPVLKEREIKHALEESFDVSQNSQSDEDFALTDDEEDVEEEEEEEDSNDENSPKKLRIDEEEEEEAMDESRRRSGRERKVPKKFEIEPPKPEAKGKNKKKPNPAGRTELVQDDSDDADYDVKGRKRKKKFSAAKELANSIKKFKKSSSPPKSKTKKPAPPPPTAKPEPQYKKLTRKIKKRPVAATVDSGEESDVSGEEVVSRSFKRRVGKKHGSGTVAASKANRAKERVKYEEDRESHSSDLRSDMDEADLPRNVANADEDVDTIDFVLDHRMGKISLGRFLLKVIKKSDKEKHLSPNDTGSLCDEGINIKQCVFLHKSVLQYKR